MESTTRLRGGGESPRPAATVALLRDSPDGLEVLLTVRPDHLSFMAGATVFPGGAVSPGDLDPRWEEASALSRSAAARLLDLEPQAALGALVCAMREAFEEVGWIAGSGPLGALKRRHADDPSSFLQYCLDLGVVLATDVLVPAGSWTTPPGAPTRFDTQFFAATVSEKWEPVPDASEVAACQWATPAATLERLAVGEILMAPPTVQMLQRLKEFDSADAALTGLGARGIGEGGVYAATLAAEVSIVLAPNPGVMTGPGTNTYVVGSGPTFVIDPAVDDERYMSEVLERAGEVSGVLVTHRHLDHVGGVAEVVDRTGAEVRAFGDAPAGAVSVVPLSDGEILDVPGARLTAFHTPGHASDHVCFYLQGSAGLFSGDCILGEGTAVIAPPDGDMGDYLHSLGRLSRLKINRIYPGHWRPLNDAGRVIEDYIGHRKWRERVILDGLTSVPSRLEEIVERAYADTPAELHAVARHSALAHLELLERRGQVKRDPSGGWCRDV